MEGCYMLGSLPYTMRSPSIISIIVFGFGGIVVTYIHTRLTKLENVVMDRCIDIEKLGKMVESTNEAMATAQENNRNMLEWIRQDNRAMWTRIEKSLSELQAQVCKVEKSQK